MSAQIPALQLFQTKGLGFKSFTRILKMLQKEERSLEDFARASIEELVAKYKLGYNVAESFSNSLKDAENLANDLRREGVSILVKGEPPYPQRLSILLGDEAPPILFIKGNLELFKSSSVGFCGSRKATDKGLKVAYRAAYSLASDGFNIVSGYAHGVDLATHQAALEAGGSTSIILAEGIMNFTLKKDIKEKLQDQNHLIISECPPTLPWNAGNAMRRNRIICGLSKALIVIESSMKGGTFAAGKKAMELGIPLFVAEYAQEVSAYDGNRYFLNKGADALRGDKDGNPTLRDIKVSLNTDWSRSNSKNNLFENH